MLMRQFKKKFHFHCRTLNDILDCGNAVTSHCEINIISLNDIQILLPLGNLSISLSCMYLGK